MSGQFDNQSIKRISRAVQGFERQNPRSQPSQKNWPSPGGFSALTIQAPDTGIPGANNYTFGMAECDVMQLVDGKWKKTDRKEEIYNPQASATLTEGLRLGWAVNDGSAWVLISKLCDDDRDFVEPDPVTPVAGGSESVDQGGA